MKHIKLYEEYTSNPDHPGFLDTYEKVKTWLDMYGVEDYIINDDLSVDVFGYVYLYDRELTYLPVQFRNVYGDFEIQGNRLTSVLGFPKKCEDTIWASNNLLTNLDGLTKQLEGLDIRNNFLTIDNYKYDIDEDNPGYEETDIVKITQNLIDKICIINIEDARRVLESVEYYRPQIYNEIKKLVDLDDWLSRLQNSEKHKDIMNL